MGRELGRISGPLLSANLERDGVDLRFEDDLLYLSVVDTSNPSKKVGVGINKLNPTRELFIDNTAHTTNLVVDTWATVGPTGDQFNFITNKIQYDGSIVLQPNQTSDPTITTTRVGTKDYALSVNYLNISDKLIENLSNNSNIQLNPSITGITQFDTNEVYVNGSLESTGNITFDGDITFGSDASDSVDFNADVNSHIIPNITNTYDLGAALQRWANVYVHGLHANNTTTITSQTVGTLIANGTSSFDGNAYLGNASTDHITFTSLFDSSLIPTSTANALGIRVGPLVSWNTAFLTELDVDGTINIVNNTITTLTTDTDLQLDASGTGKIVVTNTDVEITNNLTVDQLTTLTNLDITGLLDLTGDYTWTQTGTTQRTGATDITGSLTVNGANTVQFEDIKFVSNRITTTLPSSNLILIANGTGIIKTTVTDVEITNDLNVDLTGDFNTVNATTVYANAYDIGSVYITDNIITTNVLNTNLVLSADGAGEIHVTTTDVEITNDLEVNQLTTLTNVIIGSVGTGSGLTIATNDSGGLSGWGAGVFAVAYNPIITTTYPVGSTITFQDNSTATITFIDDYGPLYLDIFFTPNKSGILFPITLSSGAVTGGPETLYLTGNWTQTGANQRIGNTDITGSLTVNGANTVQFDDIQFVGNVVRTTLGTDLELQANGTGIVKILTSDVEITNDLDVLGTGYIDEVVVINGVNPSDASVDFLVGNIFISGNTVTTTTGNLILSADGTGEIHVTTTDVIITNDLEVNQLTTIADVGITGLLDLTGDYTWTHTGTNQRIGNTDITGSLTVNGVHTVQFDDIQFTGNIIKTTLGTDLELTANGTGIVKILTSDVEITNNLDVLGTGYLDEVVVINGVTPSDLDLDFLVGNISISGNTVTTAAGNLVLIADNAGEIHVTTTDVVITNDLEVNQLTTLADVGITGLLDLIGDNTWTHTGTSQRIGNTDITGSLTVNGANTVQFDDIQFTGNIVKTTLGTDLELSANGTGIVKIMTSNVEITNNLDVLGTGYFNNLTVGAGITNSAFTVGDFYIANNDIITTVGSNIDIILEANGAGKVYVPTNDVIISNDLTVTGNVTVVGDTSLKNTVIRTEIITPTTTQTAQNVSGTSTPTGFFFYGWADDPGQSNPPFGLIQVGWTCVQIPGSVVTVVGDGVTNYDITITGGSFASGGFYSFTGDVVSYGPATLTQTGNIDQTGDTYITGNFNNNNITILSPSYISVPDIKIEDNIISVTATDQDLELYANGTGGVVFDRYLKITNSEISSIFDPNDIELAFDKLLLAEDSQVMITEAGVELLIDSIVDGDLSIIFVPNGTGNAVIATSRSLVIPYGNSSNRVLAEVGEIRQNSTFGVYEGWTPNGLVSFNGIYDSDKNTYASPELTPGANDNVIRFGVNGTVKGYIDATKLYFGVVHADDVVISGNTINNISNSNDIVIRSTGTGSISVNDILVKDNTITNTINDALVIESTGIGYVRFSGNKALVIPAGGDADRRVTPELGETRYNTEQSYLEVYDGNNWIAAAGTSAVATEEEIVAETNLWAFILG